MELKLHRRVAAPAQTVWALLAERFADVGLWTSGLKSSRMDTDPAVGAIRTCVMPNGNQIHETLRIYSPEALEFKYQVTTGAPKWIKEASNHWTIRATGPDTCDVSAIAKVVLPWWLVPVTPLMGLALRHMGKRYLDEMEYYLANGTIHPRAAKMKIPTVTAVPAKS